MKRSRAAIGLATLGKTWNSHFPLPEIDCRPNSPALNTTYNRERDVELAEKEHLLKKRFTSREFECKRHTLPVLDQISYVKLQLEQRLKRKSTERIETSTRQHHGFSNISTPIRKRSKRQTHFHIQNLLSNQSFEDTKEESLTVGENQTYAEIDAVDERLYAKFPRFSSCLDIREIPNSGVRNLSWVLNTIEGIYDSFESSLEGSKPLKNCFPFAAFTYISQKYGDYQLASKSSWDMINSLEFYLSENYKGKERKHIVNLQQFSDFLRELLDEDVIFLFLYIRKTVKDVLNIQLHRHDKTQTLELTDKGVKIVNDVILPDDVMLTVPACNQVIQAFLRSLQLDEQSDELGKFIMNQIVLSGITGMNTTESVYLRITDFLNKIMLNYADTPEDIIRQLKYGDDGNRVHVLNRLKETLNGSQEKDKLINQLQSEKLELASAQNKVTMLEQKSRLSQENKEKYRIQLFLAKSDAWRIEQAVRTTEKNISVVDRQVDSTWNDITKVDNESMKISTRQKTQTKYNFDKKSLPIVQSPNVSLARFVKWVQRQFRKHNLKQGPVQQLQNLSWKEQLKEKEKKAATLIQEMFRLRKKLRVEEAKAKEDLEKRKLQRRRQIRIQKQLLAKQETERKSHTSRMSAKAAKLDREREELLNRQKLIISKHRHKEAQRRMQRKKRKLIKQVLREWQKFRKLQILIRVRNNRRIIFAFGEWNTFLKYQRLVKKRKNDAASIIQRVGRGMLGRMRYKVCRKEKNRIEAKIRANIIKMMNNHMLRCLISWHIYVDKCLRSKAMLANVMKKIEKKYLLLWTEYSENIKQKKIQLSIKIQSAFRSWQARIRYNKMKLQWKSSIVIQSCWRVYLCTIIARLAKKKKIEQEARLSKFLKRIRFKTSFKVFRTLSLYARRMKRVKELWALQMSSLKNRSFRAWLEWVGDHIDLKKLVATRIQSHFRRRQAQVFVMERRQLGKAAVLIQATYRGKCARAFVRQLFWDTQAAIVIERVWRGKLGRRRFAEEMQTFILSHFKEDYYDLIETSYEKGYAKNLRDPDTGDTLLHKACEVGSKRLIRLCLRNGVRITSQNSSGQTCLHSILKTSFFEQVDLVGYLLCKGAEAKLSNKNGKTPLMMAAETGKVEVVQYLAEYSNIEAKDKEYGYTSLHLAAINQRYETVQILLEAGANPECTDKDGATPLHHVAGRGMTKMMTILMAKYNELNIKDAKGNTPLHYAVFEKKMDAIVILLEWGADAAPTNDLNRTPLWYAAGAGNLEILEYLGNRESSVDDRCKKTGNTALHLACKIGNLDCVKYLLAEGADHSIQNIDGDLAVHLAVRQVQIPILKLLFKYFTNMNMKNYANRTPLGEARVLSKKSDRDKVVSLILSKYIERSPEEQFRLNEKRKATALLATFGRQTAMSIQQQHSGLNTIRTHALQNREDDLNNHQTRKLTKTLTMPELNPAQWSIILRKYSSLEFELGVLTGSPWKCYRINTNETIAPVVEGTGISEDAAEVTDEISIVPVVLSKLQNAKFWHNQVKNKYQWKTPTEIADLPEAAESWKQDWDDETQQIIFINEKTGERRAGITKPPPAKGGKYLEKRVKVHKKKHKPTESQTGEGLNKTEDNEVSVGERSSEASEESDYDEDDRGMNADQYRKYWEKENAEIRLELLREHSAIVIQVQYRRHASALRVWRARVLRDCAIKLQTRWRIVRSRLEKERRVKELHYVNFTQKLWRGAKTRKWFREQKAVLIAEKQKTLSSATINRCWRGYIGRRRFRKVYARQIIPAPKNHEEWQVVRENSEKLREFGVWDEYRYRWPDVLFYANRFTNVCRWDKPLEMIRYDEDAINNMWTVMSNGFTKTDEKCAINLQNKYRGKRMMRQFRTLTKGVSIMKKAKDAYLIHPYREETRFQDRKGIVNLCNYMLYLHTIELNPDKARSLYTKALDYMKSRGPDNAFILYSYACFVAAYCEEEQENIIDMVKRARRADPSGKSFARAEAGFFRQKTIEEPKNARALLNYAICLQFYGTTTNSQVCVSPDLELAEEYYIRAVEADPMDKQIIENFNFMLYSLKHVDYDAFECFRMYQEKRITEEQNEKLKGFIKVLEQNAAVLLQKAARRFLTRNKLSQSRKDAEVEKLIDENGNACKHYNRAGEIEYKNAHESETTEKVAFQWEEVTDEDGYVFYYNSATGESQWEKPDGFLSLSESRYIECETTDGDVFYFNPVTEESTWELPPNANITSNDYSELRNGNSGKERNWEQTTDEEGSIYFYNNITGETSWEVPDGFYKVGSFVHCLFQKGEYWYPGRIYTMNSNGTFDIVYDDGDYEENVSTEYLAAREEETLEIGCRVKTHQDHDIFLPGKIVGKSRAGYSVLYDNGEEENNVMRHRLFSLNDATENSLNDWERLTSEASGLTYYRNAHLGMCQWNKPSNWQTPDATQDGACLEGEHNAGLRELFSLMDQDGNGVLERQEMFHALHTDVHCRKMVSDHSNQGLRALLDPEFTRKAYDAMDINGCGSVTRREFITVCVEILREKEREKDIRNLFHSLKAGQDDFITKTDLKNLLTDPSLRKMVKSTPSLSGLLRPRTINSLFQKSQEPITENSFVAACIQALLQADRFAASAMLYREVVNEGDIESLVRSHPSLRALAGRADIKDEILRLETSNKSKFIIRSSEILKTEYLKSEAVRLFRLIDSDASNTIDRAELQICLSDKGGEHSQRIIDFIKTRPGLRSLLNSQTFESGFSRLSEDGIHITLNGFIQAVGECS